MSVSPPRPKGPPLNALRAFEAAARLGGFARAAEELCVTPGAVAQQVKALEDWAGAALFERRSQGVRLTALGARVGADFGAAFDRIGEAVQALRAEAAPGRVHMAALPSVAQLWLSPRLPAIRAAMPEVAISVTALEAPPNLRRDPFDLSLFFAEGDVGPEGTAVARDTIFPVCAPALLPRLGSVADLAAVPCLGDTAWADDWSAWLAHAAPGARIAARGPAFSLYSLAVEEARNGAGVLMGHAALVEGHLAAGTLVAPFPQRLALDRTLVLTQAPSARRSTATRRIVRAILGGEGG